MPDEEFERVHEAFLQLADKKKEVYDEDLEALVGESERTLNEVYHLEQVHLTCGEPGIPTATVELIDRRGQAAHRLEPRHRPGRRGLQGDQPHRRRAERPDRVQRAGRHARHRRARRGHDPRDERRRPRSSPAEERTPTSSWRARRRTRTRSTGCWPRRRARSKTRSRGARRRRVSEGTPPGRRRWPGPAPAVHARGVRAGGSLPRR